MMSKAPRKLVLKKELLRTLNERHLRVVNGGGDEPLNCYSFECRFSDPLLCRPLAQ
jgi:hypothetical protein